MFDQTSTIGFYKYGIMEMIHELGNAVQKLICVTYQFEANSEDVKKIKQRVDSLAQMIKIYTGIYTHSTYSFEELIEMIQLFHNHPITLEGNFDKLQDSPEIGLYKILLLYAMWISKRHELTIEVIDNHNAVLTPDTTELSKHYSLEEGSGIYAKLLSDLQQIFSQRIEGGKLFVCVNHS